VVARGGHTLDTLGRLCLDLGRHPEAAGHLDRALVTSEEIGDRRLEAKGTQQRGAARRRRPSGPGARIVAAGRAACAELGVPEAEALRARLAGV